MHSTLDHNHTMAVVPGGTWSDLNEWIHHAEAWGDSPLLTASSYLYSLIYWKLSKFLLYLFYPPYIKSKRKWWHNRRTIDVSVVSGGDGDMSELPQYYYRSVVTAETPGDSGPHIASTCDTWHSITRDTWHSILHVTQLIFATHRDLCCIDGLCVPSINKICTLNVKYLCE